MASKKKLLQAAAGSAGGAGLDVDEVFSTYLYDGTGSTQTITNGIDLSGEGGLVWIKRRDGADGAGLFDTVRGATKGNFPSSTSAEITDVNSLTSFNSNGFTLGTGYTNFAVNGNNMEHVAWTWRKTPKFFDVVTYSGSSSAQTIAHNLGVTPAVMIVKQLNSSGRWTVYHKDASPTGNPQNGRMSLNTTDAWLEYPTVSSFQNLWNLTAPTSTHFTVGTDATTGASGSTYVAYLFAHNDGDGDFGLTNDQDIIKCGSYTTDASADATINLGFEPQWVMFRPYDDTSDWKIIDNMRGFVATPTSGNYNKQIAANSSGAEADNDNIKITSTGFEHVSGFASKNFIYMAIRRGPLAKPTSATDVFAPIAYTTTDGSWQDRILQSNFTTDLAINGYRNITDGGTHTFVDRLRGYANILRSHQTNAESVRSADYYPWPQTGQSVTSNEWSKYNAGNGLDYYNYQWKRAPGYFDVVTYTGTGSARTVSHNLGAVPEMMWIKGRNQTASWIVGGSAIGNGTTNFLILNSNSAMSANTSYFNNTAQTSSVLNIGASAATNNSGSNYIAYLFATVAGVSKVGSYTGNGSTQNIDCGFSSGARFVLIKSTTQATEWNVFDTARGIVSGNDPALLLDTTDAEYTSYDLVDPYSSGFAVNYVGAFNGTNTSGQTYIFYAIA